MHFNAIGFRVAQPDGGAMDNICFSWIIYLTLFRADVPATAVAQVPPGRCRPVIVGL